MTDKMPRCGALSMSLGSTGTTQEITIVASLMREETSEGGVRWWTVIVCGKLKGGISA